jgi:uncharacterized membrane protein YphA (DoxX/SURF4 family)
MKIVTNLFRVIIGLTFIFSGFVKLDDPTGFSYKLDEYFSVFAGDVETTQDTVYISTTFNGEEFKYQRTLFVNDAPIPLLSTTSIKRIASEENPEDTLWKGNVAIYFDNQLILSKDYQLLDSLQTAVVVTNIHVGDKSIYDNSSTVSINSKDNSEEQSIDVSASVKADSWLVGFFNGMKPIALYIGIFVSIIEVLLGFALLIGWKPKLTAWLLLLLTLFFAFLTWYSWKFDKVTDCGCFGDAIPLNPYQSLIKNGIFLALILVVMFTTKKIKPIFSNPFAVKVMAIVVFISGAFAGYCKHYLPVIDYLKFKEGNNICELIATPEGKRVRPWKITNYEYIGKDGETIIVKYDSDENTFTPPFQSDWKYSKLLGEEILEEAYEPPIHDFMLMDLQQSNNYIDEFFASDQKLLIVMHDLTKVNKKAMPKIKKIAEQWVKDGKAFWALTSSSAEQAEAFRHEHNLTFDIYLGDNTNLKSIIRSNPGLLLITDTCVVKKVWPSTRLPKYKKLQKLTK